MTVGSSLSKAGPFIADGVQKEFPYEFSVLDPTHIAVWMDGVRVSKGFTVTQNSIVFDEAPAAGSRISFIRDVPFTQETDIQNNTAFFPEVIETALDKLTMIAQQLEEADSRALKTVPTDPAGVDALLNSIYDAAQNSRVAAQAAAESADSASGKVAEIEAARSEVAGSVGEIREALKKSAGVPLGSVYATPCAFPPEGAYLLNGQTIANCRELYPGFWEWLGAENIVVTPIYKAWTMPALTAETPVGGSEYAAEASEYLATNAFSSFSQGAVLSPSIFAQVPTYGKATLTWYSPVKLKISKLILKNGSYTDEQYNIGAFEIFGSNDNSSWKSLFSGTMESKSPKYSQTVELPASLYDATTPGYQYLKIEAIESKLATKLCFPFITLYGEEYLYDVYTGRSGARIMDGDTYESTLSQCGVCGGFVADVSTGSVRLPSVVNGTLWGADISNIGQSLAAGLPNIEGGYTGDFGNPTGTYYSSGTVSGDAVAGSSGSKDQVIHFDASRSNPIYGNSDTVQPPAIRVSWCIQVFNAATDLSEQESAQLASEMQTKAQVDFANVNSNLDFVVESWTDGAGGWYRQYRSGWVEQGGIVPDGSAAAVTVNFWVEMRDTLYTPVVTPSSSGSGSSTARAMSCYNRTETGLTVFLIDSSNEGTNWKVEGYAATE